MPLEHRPDPEEVNLNGHLVRGCDLPRTEYRDNDGNYVLFQDLDLSLLNRFEDPRALKLMEIWQDLGTPSVGDLDWTALRMHGIADWLHIVQYEADIVARFQRFAPAMIRYSGNDATGRPILASGAMAYSKGLNEINHRVRQTEAPYYGRVYRTLNLKNACRDAAMRRLELPLYHRGVRSGSAVMILPDIM